VKFKNFDSLENEIFDSLEKEIFDSLKRKILTVWKGNFDSFEKEILTVWKRKFLTVFSSVSRHTVCDINIDKSLHPTIKSSANGIENHPKKNKGGLLNSLFRR
jgi:hypothetical protein